eukprot:ANDGO_05585.mRNA.1 hypothetical protein ACA1_070020
MKPSKFRIPESRLKLFVQRRPFVIIMFIFLAVLLLIGSMRNAESVVVVPPPHQCLVQGGCPQAEFFEHLPPSRISLNSVLNTATRKFEPGLPDGFQQELAIVVPYVASHLQELKSSISLWGTEEYFPGKGDASSVLVFYFNLSPKEQRAHIPFLQRAILEDCGTRCIEAFSHIVFLAADLLPWQDSYTATAENKDKSVKTSVGTVYMFYPLFFDPFLKSHFKFFFYMEPDVKPIRARWLPEVEKQIQDRPDGLMLGSIFRGPFPEDMPRFGVTFLVHINGNAIYRLGDPAFDEYLQYVWSKWPHQAFDIQIRAGLYQEEPWHFVQNNFHRFVAGEWIQNYGRTSYSKSSLVQSSPRTYLVHSRYQLP